MSDKTIIEDMHFLEEMWWIRDGWPAIGEIRKARCTVVCIACCREQRERGKKRLVVGRSAYFRIAYLLWVIGLRAWRWCEWVGEWGLMWVIGDIDCVLDWNDWVGLDTDHNVGDRGVTVTAQVIGWGIVGGSRVRGVCQWGKVGQCGPGAGRWVDCCT